MPWLIRAAASEAKREDARVDVRTRFKSTRSRGRGARETSVRGGAALAERSTARVVVCGRIID